MYMWGPGYPEGLSRGVLKMTVRLHRNSFDRKQIQLKTYPEFIISISI